MNSIYALNLPSNFVHASPGKQIDSGILKLNRDAAPVNWPCVTIIQRMLNDCMLRRRFASLSLLIRS